MQATWSHTQCRAISYLFIYAVFIGPAFLR
uniref:Uncharacterized protein n=1 Tax=Anguilla anguilla TaxID=7936 RepID=A0A0E9T8A2_ANGAN